MLISLTSETKFIMTWRDYPITFRHYVNQEKLKIINLNVSFSDRTDSYLNVAPTFSWGYNATYKNLINQKQPIFVKLKSDKGSANCYIFTTEKTVAPGKRKIFFPSVRSSSPTTRICQTFTLWNIHIEKTAFTKWKLHASTNIF